MMDKREILIIDDDRDLALSLQAMLRDRNYHVCTANDSATGMEMLKARRPDLLMLDVMMESQLEGQKFALAVKRDPAFVDLPILVITGMLDAMGVNPREMFEEVEDLPNVSILDKPFGTAELISMVEKLTTENQEA
jgi:DNA-binding response OmpR family regulator